MRWVIIDELPMVADHLLGSFEHRLTESTVECRYKDRAGKSARFMGGYSLLGFGYFYQISPIPLPAPLGIPPLERKTEAAKRRWPWSDGKDFFNVFMELTIQKRILGPWCASVVNGCRNGNLSQESYNYLVGLATEHSVSWQPDGTLRCQSERCADLPEQWTGMAVAGPNGTSTRAMAGQRKIVAIACSRRETPVRVWSLTSSAPLINKNNEPKYQVMLVRAAEQAKTDRKHIILVTAVGTPDNLAQIAGAPAKLEHRLERLFH